ncbi:MAG: hypothetical protein AABX51_02730 [Nanoarchaeota archaeon]
MTIGISLQNGLEAVVLIDTRKLNGQNISDSVRKAGQVQGAFPSVLFGIGEEGIIRETTRRFNRAQSSSYDAAIEQVFEYLRSEIDRLDARNLSAITSQAQKISSAYPEPNRRAQILDFETTQGIQNLKQQSVNDYRQNTHFGLVGFDNEENRIRQAIIYPHNFVNYDAAHMELGSVKEAVFSSLGLKLSGVDTTKLSVPQMAHFVVNAYTSATTAYTVGGVPLIGIVREEGTQFLSDDTSTALMNASGAYQSGFALFPIAEQLHAFEEGMAGNYARISTHVKMDVEMLTRMPTRYADWQMRVNADVFPRLSPEN